MEVTNQDVCEFFGFFLGLNLELPGSMVMMLEGLVEKGARCLDVAYIANEGWSCNGWLGDIFIGTMDRKSHKVIGYDTAPLAVLGAVRQLIKEVRG